MRILNVTQAYYPFLHRGGPAIKVRSIARGLIDLGNEVTVLTADLGFDASEIQLAGAIRDPRGWLSRLDGIETIYLRTLGHYRNLTVNPGVLQFCRRRLREFDLVHIYGLYDMLGPAVAWYCRRFAIPYIVEPLGMTRPIDRGFLLKNIWRRAAGCYLNKAGTIVVTSHLEREELLAEGFPSEQLLLRYNGLDLGEFRQLPPPGSFRKRTGLGENDRFVLFLGRLIPRKGADLLIDALPRLQDRKVKLVIAGPEGEAGYLAALRARAATSGVAGQVLFVGPLYGEDKKAALADADVFALPSRYENFGNAAAEAIACGTPVLVSDQCGIAPLIAGRAGLVTAYDATAIASALNRMLGDAARYRQLQQGCAGVAEEFSWDKLVREMQECYQHESNAAAAALTRHNPAVAIGPAARADD